MPMRLAIEPGTATSGLGLESLLLLIVHVLITLE